MLIRVRSYGVAALMLVTGTGCFVNSRMKPNANSTSQTSAITAVAKPPIANLVLSVGAAYAPTHYMDVKVGDTVEFYWNGSNGDLFESTYTPDAADTCPASAGTGPHPWVAANSYGMTQRQIAACEAGRTYLYAYKVTDSNSGIISTAYNMIHVQLPGQQTPPFFTAITATVQNPDANQFAGPAGLITANVGQQVLVAWSSNNVDSTSAVYSVDTPDTCGDLSLTLPRIPANQPTKLLDLIECMGGHTYTIIYQGFKAGALAAQATLVLKVRENPQMPDPKATLSLNGQTGTVSVKVGDTLNYTWSSENADMGDSSIVVSGASTAGDCADDQARGDKSRPWDARSSEGTLPASTVPACRAGKTYTISYTASESKTGKSASSVLVVNFLPSS